MRRRTSHAVSFVRSMCVALTVACLAMLTLTQRVLIAQDGLAMSDLQRKIQGERLSQQRLEMALLTLESPARIQRQAQEKLRMVEPQKVSYMQIPLDRPTVASRPAPAAKARAASPRTKPKTPGIFEAVFQRVTGQVQLLPLGNVGIFSD